MIKLFVLLCFYFVQLASAGSLQVALSDVAPFAYMQNEKMIGYHMEIFAELEKLTGIKFHYSLLPHARINHFLEKDSMDLAITTRLICKKSSELFISSPGLYQNHPTVFINVAKKAEKKPKIGRLISTCSAFASKYRELEMVDLTTMQAAADLMKSGRLDGLCGLPPVINHYLKKNNSKIELIKLYTDQFESDYEAVLCIKKSLDPLIIQKITSQLKNIRLPKDLEK